MQRPERPVPGVAAILLLLLPGTVPAAPDADAALFRHRAPVRVEQPAPFLRLPLGPEVYAKSLHPGLADLRLVDAGGQRVPFALLAPRDDELQSQPSWRDATLYRLPPRPADPTAPWTAPVDLRVEGGRITVRQQGAFVLPERSPGWLVDLGERTAGAAAPRTLRLRWSGMAEFSAGYRLEHGSDLKTWAPAGTGQLVALAAPAAGAPLTQPDVALPAEVGRFVRLVWTGDGTPPPLTSAQAATPGTRSVALDPPHALTVGTSTEPASAHAGAAAARALHFDLGAVLPVVRIELLLPPATRVLPVQVQRRERADARWEPAAATVFYRIGDAAPPPLALDTRTRYLRLVVDERVALPAADGVRLVAQAQLASLVFSAQGEPPLALLAGSDGATVGALPLATLVPDAERERPRFGRASLGTWTEHPAAAARQQRAQRLATIRPWLLWSVLIGGVAALAVLVWRLARGGRPAPPPG